MPKGRGRLLAMSGQEAGRFGCIVSFRNARGETWSWTRPGAVLDVVRDACDAAELRDPTNLVVCISTPTSIYSDLAGRPLSERNGLIEHAEAGLLSRAGRRYMTHPYLRGSGH